MVAEHIRIMGLSQEQIIELKDSANISGNFIGRFVFDRKSINVCTGDLIGGNVIHQYVYWDYSKEWFNKVLSGLQERNPNKDIKIIYSKD